MLVTLASIAFLASALLLHAPLAGSSRQRLGRGLAFHLAALGLQVGVYLAGGIHTRLRRMTFAESYLLNIYYTCPDLGLLFLLALLIGASLVLWHARQWRYAAGINAWLADARAALRGFVAARPEIVFSLIFVSATLLAIFVYTRVYVIRYLFVAVPFFYIVLSELLYAARFRRALWAAPVALIALNVVNADGRFFPAPPGNRRHCSVLERSREYLADHRSNIAAMRRLDDVAGDTPIVAGYPYSYFLSMPRLGYVRQPRRGYAIMPLSTGNFKPVAELLRDRPTRLIFTAAENPSHRLGPISPPEFTEGDQTLYRDQLNPPLLIFAKDLSPLAQSPEALDRWYAEHLWGGGPENLPPDLFAARARHLADMGRGDLAVAALEGRVRRVPSDLATNLELAQMLIQQGRSEEAIAASCAAIGQSVNQAPKNPIFALAHGHYLLGLALLQQRRLDDALSRFAETLRNAPQHVQAHFQAGVAWLAKGSPAEAEREFRAAVQLDPGHLAARYHLGYALEQSGRLSEAAEVYRGILQIDPKHLDARARLAALVVSGQS
jgi:Flp pilus assembly protein TadD